MGDENTEDKVVSPEADRRGLHRDEGRVTQPPSTQPGAQLLLRVPWANDPELAGLDYDLALGRPVDTSDSEPGCSR